MASGHDEGGVLPEVHDEAADTPMWVPALGLGLLTLITVFLIVRAALSEDESAPAGADVVVQVEAR